MHYYKPTWLDLVRFDDDFFPLMITHGITTKAQFYAREAIVIPVAGQMSDFLLCKEKKQEKGIGDWAGLGISQSKVGQVKARNV